ncbi:class I SAM-dependent methyltransferase [Spiractinospora alimapuensis]|uniref:class I SAM-dependent methyltransferase n=1 Tax=Spiractinospora alimapuensis TaxID=2820884 RepID=UPI001F2FFCA4|nr:class I SAM-dependent methyltransferase [Spiractinospora alimapuensis]QVQ53022.1 class I SAM-dependent methyltransferase [Spiractinospora alimapuensis]
MPHPTPRPWSASEASDEAVSSEYAQSNITGYWDHRAESYDAFQTRRLRNDEIRRAWLSVWARHLPASPARILDAGTGPGHMARLLTELGHSVIGIDASQGMIDRARAHARVHSAPTGTSPEYLRADAVAPDFPPNSFDVVTSRYVLWTLRTPEEALANWLRLLRPGGRLVCVDSTWFPDGVRAGGTGDASFRSRYDDQVLARLPLAESDTIEDTAAAVRRAGFAATTVTPLPELLELDHRHGVARDHEPRIQFVVSARRDRTAPPVTQRQ